MESLSRDLPYPLFFEADEIAVIRANLFLNGPIRTELKTYVHIPRLSQSFCIFHRDVDFKIILVHTLEALDHVQLIAVRTARAIKPAFVVETNCVYYESIAIPTAD